jgi:phage shock protein A
MVIGVLVLGLFLLGPGEVWTTVLGSREVVQDEVEAAKPDVQRAAEIRVLLGNMEEQSLEYADKLAEVEQRAADARQRQQTLKRRLASERSRLEQAQELLKSDKQRFTIGGQTYTREAVNTDARQRLKRARRIEQQLETQREVVQQLVGAVETGRHELARAKRIRKQKAAELESLEARLQNARLLKRVNELSDDLRDGDALGPKTRLAEKFDSFQRRVRRTERRARVQQEGADTGVVDWDGTAESAESTRRMLERYLHAKKRRDGEGAGAADRPATESAASEPEAP